MPWSTANVAWLEDTRTLTLEMLGGISVHADKYIHCKGNREGA